jgi:KaiC/GvpD/RAD55 family RecA-like ATPase
MPEEQALPPKKKSQAEEIEELMDYLKTGGSLGLEIEKKFEEMPEKYAAIFVTRQEKNNLVIANLIKNFCKKGLPGIFVTMNKSAEDLLKIAENNHVPCENMLIVDTVSKKESMPLEKSDRVTYVDSPQDLTEIETEIAEFMGKMQPGPKYFILDSVSTMLVYNAEKTVEKFVHRLGERLRAENFKAIFIVMEGTRPEILNVLSQFCDKVIKPSPVINSQT